MVSRGMASGITSLQELVDDSASSKYSHVFIGSVQSGLFVQESGMRPRPAANIFFALMVALPVRAHRPMMSFVKHQ